MIILLAPGGSTGASLRLLGGLKGLPIVPIDLPGLARWRHSSIWRQLRHAEGVQHLNQLRQGGAPLIIARAASKDIALDADTELARVIAKTRCISVISRRGRRAYFRYFGGKLILHVIKYFVAHLN